MPIDNVQASCDFHRGFDSRKQQKKKKRSNYSKKRYNTAFELLEKKDRNNKDDIILKRTFMHDLPRKYVSKEEHRKGKKSVKKQNARRHDVKQKKRITMKKDVSDNNECTCFDTHSIFEKQCDHEDCFYIDEGWIIGEENKCIHCKGKLPSEKQCYRKKENKSVYETDLYISYSELSSDDDYDFNDLETTIVFNHCYCPSCETQRMKDDIERAKLLRLQCHECYNDFRKCGCQSSAIRRFNFLYHGYW